LVTAIATAITASHQSNQRETPNHNSPRRGNPRRVRKFGGWYKLLRFQARRLESTQYVFGLKWSGHMTAARMRLLLRNLPAGSAEIYFHPAVRRDAELQRLMPDYEHEAELRALLELKTAQ
jgi:hypothetical protein